MQVGFIGLGTMGRPMAVNLARAALPNTATAQELFTACAARGGKAWDHSALVRALELLASHEVGSDA